MRRHRREWPTLWRAIDDLLRFKPLPLAGGDEEVGDGV